MLDLTKATITRIEVVGMGDRVCVDLCSLMQPGEGLLVHLYFFSSGVCLHVPQNTIFWVIEMNLKLWFINWYVSFCRLDPLLEDYFWFTQSAWKQITLLADLSESMLLVSKFTDYYYHSIYCYSSLIFVLAVLFELGIWTKHLFN